MDRRKFLRAIALTGAAFTLKESEAMSVLTQSFNSTNAASSYDLVAVMGGEPEVMFRKAIAEMGGMKKFISPGDKVVVKPNIGWDQPVEMAANTNPKLVTEIIKQCFDAGAKEVTVFDHTCDKGRSLKTTKIHQAIVDSDKWINVPILKNHGGAQLTISMKNYMGIVWDRGYFHANDLQQCIADVCTYEKRPVLNVVDAYRLMKTSGPRGKSISDVVLSKGLFISQDIVAVDTAAANFFNQVREMPLEKVAHIGKAQELKLGTMELSKLNIKRIKI